MNSPAEAKTCSRCGAPLTPGALQGLCPRCLLALNLATQTELTGDDSGQIGGSAVPRPEPPTLEELARHFSGLEILELLGRGGMGAVYKVRQKQLDRIVALKILPPRPGDDSAFAERFTREAKALAKLLHPNIVALFEFGQANGIYYLLMEFVDGVSLGQLLRSSRVSPREALAIVPQICDALQYAHDQGIVHRDIKPENILLDRRGRVKVADFGLAKLVEAKVPLTPALSPSAGERVADRPGEGKTPVLTEAGKIMGTPNYMAPEQVEHPGEVDHRADIYALGVVFYQMLTGELPSRRMEPPSKKVQIDVRLDEVVLRALERNPERRYQQVSEVKTCLETIVATPPGSSRREAAQNAGGKAGEGLPTSIVRSERARLTVQECADARVNYPAMGEVTLHTDRLVISSGNNQRSIPLADIHALGEAVLPFWVSPGPHRYAAVDFDEAGQPRRLVFLAGSSIFRTPGDTRLHAAEWLTAIQQTMKSAIGRGVPVADGPTVVPVRIWRYLVWLLVPLAAALPLMASLLSQRDPGGLSVTDAALMSGAFMLIPVLTLSIVFVVRSCSLRGTVKRPLGCATVSAGGPPAKQGGVKEAHDRPHFSRTAIVGVCFGILGLLALILYAVIGDSNLLDEGPSNVLAALTALCLLVSAILGWVAVSQLRRSAGKLHGMWLAVSEGLLFPLLALDGLIAFQASTIVETSSAIDAVLAQVGIQPGSGELFKWLAGIATVFICAVLNTLITWGVWRAVNKRSAGVPLAGSENSVFGKWACGPLLVGTLGPSLLMTVVPWQEGWAEGLSAAVGSVALALALVWGLIRWRQRLGKCVVIAASVLCVALIVAAAILSFVIVPAKRVRLEAAFGPVTECTWPLDAAGWTPLFDLDRNQPVPDPKPGDTAGNMAQHLAELKKPGMAIHYDGQTHVVAVSGMTIHKTDGDGNPWERITDMEDLATPDGFGFLLPDVTGLGSWQTADFPGKLPLTLFFKTGVTRLGLLQITGFTENPRAVKLRYKVIASRASGIGSASSHSTSPAQAATPVQPAAASGSPPGPVGGKASPANHHLTPVPALAARRGDIRVYLEGLGTVQSSNSVLFHISEDRVQSVVKKFDRREPLPVDAYDREGTEFGHGVLLAVDNSIDTATGTLACKARLLPVGDNLMVPGLFVNIRMLLEVKHGVVLVSAEAIQREAGSAFVWVIKPDQTVSRRPVQLGTIEEREPTGGSTDGQNAGASGPWAEVKSGVSPGELVATSDFQNLREGREVRYKLVQPVPQSEQAPQGPPAAAKEAAKASANPRASQAAEVTFSVTAAGTAPFTYQWRHDTTNPAEASSPATDSVAPHGPPFIARLAQGEVELLALSHHPSSNQPWWRPDGTPWTNAVFHNPDTRSSPTKGQRFEFVLRRLGLPQDTTLECSFEPGTGEVSMGSHPWRQGKELPDHDVIETVLPQSAKEVTIKLGVAGGEWKPMVTRTPEAGGGGAFPLGRQTCRALFLDPAESGGEARIAVSYNKVPGWTTRVTALDTSGNLHVSLPHGESLDDVATMEGRFPGLSLSRVKQFRFEARPFTWFEFRHIALQLGKHTQVEVVEAAAN